MKIKGWLVGLLLASSSARANCDWFFYSGEPLRMTLYNVSYIKKNMPDIFFPEVARPVPLGSDLLIQWSNQAGNCLLDSNTGVFSPFPTLTTLQQLQSVKGVRDDLASPYTNDSFSETRRVNNLLKSLLASVKQQIATAETPKVKGIRDRLTATCLNFDDVMGQIDRIMNVAMPIKARQQYIKTFCSAGEEKSRQDFLNRLESLRASCNQGHQDSCDLLDVYDYVDCESISDTMSSSFDQLIDKFSKMKTRLTQLKSSCIGYTIDILQTGKDLGMPDSITKIPDPDGTICTKLAIDTPFCAR